MSGILNAKARLAPTFGGGAWVDEQAVMQMTAAQKTKKRTGNLLHRDDVASKFLPRGSSKFICQKYIYRLLFERVRRKRQIFAYVMSRVLFHHRYMLNGLANREGSVSFRGAENQHLERVLVIHRAAWLVMTSQAAR